jgi:hypothetical protein
MPMKTIQVVLGAGATQVTSVSTPFQELRLNASAADYYVGDANVSTTTYFAKVPTSGGAATIIGNGPSNIAIDNLKNVYLIGTQSGVINLGVIVL